MLSVGINPTDSIIYLMKINVCYLFYYYVIEHLTIDAGRSSQTNNKVNV
jgi:hypothetical protein